MSPAGQLSYPPGSILRAVGTYWASLWGRGRVRLFGREFLRSLKERGLDGVELVISDAHKGLRKAIATVMCASWQRCRVHFMRNALAHVQKRQHLMVVSII